MLNNNNHKNSSSSLTSCDYSERLVSYVYGETKGPEKLEFEAHLKKCTVCSDELAAFSGVHFSISEWKSREFAALETPLIEIPYIKNESRPETSEVSGVSDSWLDALRGLLSLNPAWAGGAALAAVTIVAFVAFYGTNPGPDIEMADKGNKTPDKKIVSPTAQNNAPQIVTNKDADKSPDNEIQRENDVRPILAGTDEPGTKNKRPEKISDNPRKNKETDKPEAPKTNRVKTTPKKDTPDADEDLTPSYADDEDDSLRLADLFDEIDTE